MITTHKKPIIIISLISIAALLIGFIVITHTNQPTSNDKVNLLTIDNFNDLYHNINQNTANDIFTALYNTVEKNLKNNTPPRNGASIRTSSPFLYQYYKDFGLYRGNFIVDIPDIQQSYRITFFQNDETNNNTINVGYRILVTCLTETPQIYPDFNCQDLAPDNITEKDLL